MYVKCPITMVRSTSHIIFYFRWDVDLSSPPIVNPIPPFPEIHSPGANFLSISPDTPYIDC